MKSILFAVLFTISSFASFAAQMWIGCHGSSGRAFIIIKDNNGVFHYRSYGYCPVGQSWVEKINILPTSLSQGFPISGSAENTINNFDWTNAFQTSGDEDAEALVNYIDENEGSIPNAYIIWEHLDSDAQNAISGFGIYP